MRMIEVTSVSDEPEFDTFDEAINASRELFRAARAERDSNHLRNHAISAVFYSDTSLLLGFAGASFLSIHLSDELIEWSIINDSLPPPPLSDATILLRFSGKADPFVWHRDRTARSLVGASFKRLSVSPAWVFLYVDGASPLMCSRLRDTATNASLLYFDEI